MCARRRCDDGSQRRGDGFHQNDGLDRRGADIDAELVGARGTLLCCHGTSLDRNNIGRRYCPVKGSMVRPKTTVNGIEPGKITCPTAKGTEEAADKITT